MTPENFIYKPPVSPETQSQKVTMGVKFCNDIFLSEQFLKDKKIEYQESDLEDTPMGRCARIKRQS